MLLTINVKPKPRPCTLKNHILVLISKRIGAMMMPRNFERVFAFWWRVLSWMIILVSWICWKSLEITVRLWPTLKAFYKHLYHAIVNQ